MIVPSNLDEMIPAVCNTGDQEILGNITAAVALDLPWLQLAEPHDGTAVIVGGGPSMKALLPMIAAHQRSGHKVFAVNNTTPSLNIAGVNPDYFVLLDSKPSNVYFVKPHKDTKYLIASQCNPVVFAALEGHDVTIWHPSFPGIWPIIGDKPCAVIGGGSSVGLLALSVAFCMGYRTIHVYGLDSSYSHSGMAHAYAQDADDDCANYNVNGVEYSAAKWMVRQAIEFQDVAVQLAAENTIIHVHGYGLLPAVAQAMIGPNKVDLNHVLQ